MKVELDGILRLVKNYSLVRDYDDEELRFTYFEKNRVYDIPLIYLLKENFVDLEDGKRVKITIEEV